MGKWFYIGKRTLYPLFKTTYDHTFGDEFSCRFRMNGCSCKKVWKKFPLERFVAWNLSFQLSYEKVFNPHSPSNEVNIFDGGSKEKIIPFFFTFFNGVWFFLSVTNWSVLRERPHFALTMAVSNLCTIFYNELWSVKSKNELLTLNAHKPGMNDRSTCTVVSPATKSRFCDSIDFLTLIFNLERSTWKFKTTRRKIRYSRSISCKFFKSRQ